MNKIFKVKVLALGVFATLALSSCGSNTKKAEEKKTETEQVVNQQAETPEVKAEEGCDGKCEGCPNEGQEEKTEEGCGGACGGECQGSC